MHPSTNPNPGPKTRPASTSRKNTSSTPATPALRLRSAALTAVSTPSNAIERASMPPSDSSASTTSTTTGSSARKRNGGATWAAPGSGTSSSGQANISSPASDASESTAFERWPSGSR